MNINDCTAQRKRSLHFWMHMRPIMSRRRVGERKRQSRPTEVTNINVFVRDFNTDYKKQKHLSCPCCSTHTAATLTNAATLITGSFSQITFAVLFPRQPHRHGDGGETFFFFVVIAQLAAWPLATVKKSLKKRHSHTHSHTHLKYDYTQRGQPTGSCVQGYWAMCL